MTSYLKLQVLLKASTPLEATVLHDNWDLERVFAQREWSKLPCSAVFYFFSKAF